MKKIILLVLIMLCTGCFEESGKLVTICTKKEDINSLHSEIKYTINFKTDIVNDVEIVYSYNSTDKNTISSIKSSINSSDRFIDGLKKNVLIDNDNEFEISYSVTLEDSKTILDKFYIEQKRSNIVKTLNEKGFECN